MVPLCLPGVEETSNEKTQAPLQEVPFHKVFWGCEKQADAHCVVKLEEAKIMMELSHHLQFQYYIRAPVGILAVVPPLQLPASTPGKAAEDGTSV